MNSPVLHAETKRVQRERLQKWHPLFASASAYCVTALICVFVLNSLYKLWRIDLTIPLVYDWDATFYTAVVKNFVEAGHYYVNPLLGAPGIQELYDFPIPHAMHLIALAILGLFTRNFGLVI